MLSVVSGIAPLDEISVEMVLARKLAAVRGWSLFEREARLGEHDVLGEACTAYVGHCSGIYRSRRCGTDCLPNCPVIESGPTLDRGIGASIS